MKPPKKPLNVTQITTKMCARGAGLAATVGSGDPVAEIPTGPEASSK